MISGPGDGRAHAAEVETRPDLLGRLVQRVIDLLAVDLGHYVERGFGCHGPRLDAGGAVGTVAPPRGRIVSVGDGRRVLTSDAGSAILHCAVDAGGARQVARVAKGSGL